MISFNNKRHEFTPTESRLFAPKSVEKRGREAEDEKTSQFVQKLGEEGSPLKLGKVALGKLRYAQATMRDTTSDGLPVDQMAKNMREAGYDRKHPINVVIMPPGPHDSPLKPQEPGKLVAFDTRRTKAARKVAREVLPDEEFFAYVKLKDHKEPAENEYESLKHLTFKNNKIPEHIRKVWIHEWNRWHEPRRLAEAGITPQTWGHLIKLRMAMSMNVSDSDKAKTNAGFKVSPFVRKSREPRQNEGVVRENATKRNLF